MIGFVDNTGKIIGGCYANSPNTLSTITKTPDGCTAMYIDDTKYPDVWTNLGEWQIQNGIPVNVPIPDSVKLSNAQQAQISQLEQGLAETLNGGFVAKTLVGGATTPHTYPSDASAQSNFSGAVNGFITNPNKATVMILTLDAGWLSHTKDEFYGVYSDGDSWKEAQYAQLTGLVGQVQSATTVTAVNSITWTPATY